MTSGRPIRLTEGLPACFTPQNNGFATLCKLLAINSRQKKQELVNHLRVKRFMRGRRSRDTRDSKTAVRLQQEITYLYSSPAARRAIWKGHHEFTSGFQETPPLGAPPSLEYLALEKYDEDFSNAVVDKNRLSACGEIVDLESEHPDWRAPALAVLPSVRADFKNWHSLAPERRSDLLLAAFSIATILDDARLLLWAAREHTEIAEEFDFTVPSEESLEATREQPGEAAHPVIRQAGLSTEDVADALRQACQHLSSAALELMDEPSSVALFDRVAGHAGDVAQLRESVLEAAASKTESLIVWFIEFIREQSKDAPWLSAEADSIESRWRDKYPTTGSGKTTALQTDVERAEREVLLCLEDWSSAAAEAAEANTSLRACQDELAAASDVAARLRASEQEEFCLQAAHSANGRERKAMLRVLDAASPFGSEYVLLQDSTSPSESESETGNSGGPPKPDMTPTGEAGETAGNQKEKAGATQAVESGVDLQNDAVPELDRRKTDKATARNRVTKELPADPQTDTELDNDESQAAGLNEIAIWHAVEEGRIGLAYQIARLRPEVEPAGVLHPTSQLLAAVALGGGLCGPEGEVAHEFGRHAEDVLAGPDLEDVESETRDALNLLLFSASLRPALFAPQTGAILLLQGVELSGELTAVYRLAETIAGYAQRLQGIHFDVARLNSVLDDTVWEDHLEKHTEQVREWRASAGSERFLFGPAGKVWRHWLNKGGILFELAGLITGDGEASIPKVRGIIAKLDDNRSFAHLVDDTYRNKLGIKAGDRISGRALTQLGGDVGKAIRLGRNWLRIVEAKPKSEGFVENAVADLRRDIDKFAPKALEAINKAQEGSPITALFASLVRARESVESLRLLFGHDRDYSDTDESCDPWRLLTQDLLYVAGQDIEPDGSIDKGSAATETLSLLTDTGSHVKSLAEAFEMRLGRGDIAGAQAVCAQMVFEEDPKEDAYRNQLSRVLAKKRQDLERGLDESSERLEQAYKMGEVSENELAALNATIVSARELLTHEDSVVDAARAVSGFKDSIEDHFNRGMERMRAQFEPYLPLEHDREQAFVEHALETSDLLTLYEQLDRLKTGDSLLSKEPDERGHLSKFLAAVSKIDEVLDGKAAPAPSALVGSVSKGEDVMGLSFSSLTQSQAQRSAKLLKLWYSLARGRSADTNKIQGLLECLGFTVRECQPHATNCITASVEPLRNRELCPIHPFGSDANGNYEIVLNWRSPPQEPIVQCVGEHRNRCVIVLHFGRLADDEREWLRGWSIRNRSPFIAADETLMLYLASLQGGTLRAFFDCTLPFTASQPFFTAAGLVPPESFYGREQERQEVMDRWESCFVYGGRQLGKTALLRSVEADFHDPESRQVAKWVDLKVHDIGLAHGAENIWKTLWDVLQELGVIEPRVRLPSGRDGQVDTLRDAVCSWTSQGEDSRILLLLDEADAFLADDLKKDFRESTRLKGLMDETKRKFKVVFSGLHNVLRTTDQANHPLAHFGEPICVGPLLSNGELEQARALLREPLAAAGGKFETDNLPTHILVWTNYYPSLIQLYGAELVQYLRDSAGRPFPYTVTIDDIKAVFARHGLRDYIRQRFSLTLQLDPRYEVIAYAMALRLQGDGAGLSQGLRPLEVLALAKDWWPAGFVISEKEFDTLLEEMRGLGVLRRHRKEGETLRYTFRNPNVLLLLGDSKEIEQVLYKEREVPEAFEASAFHAHYPDEKKKGPSSPRRGPLTYAQESLLVRRGGVVIVSGTRAANIGGLGEFLGQRMDKETCRNLKLCTDDAGLVSQLTELRPGTRGVHVYLVPREAPWTLRWIEKSASAIKRLRRGDRIRLVFSAGPQQLWRFISDLPELYFEESNGLFEWFGIQPWNHAFLRRWCSDHNLQVGTPKVGELLEISGGWPSVLEHYAESRERNWTAKTNEIRDYIASQQNELLDLLGLGSTQAQKEIFALHDYDAFTPEEAREAAGLLEEVQETGANGEALAQRLWWAKQLGLFQDAQGTWGLNSLLKEILPNTGP